MNKEAAYCACAHVQYDPVTNPDGISTERWRCRDCGTEFTKRSHIAALEQWKFDHPLSIDALSELVHALSEERDRRKEAEKALVAECSKCDDCFRCKAYERALQCEGYDKQKREHLIEVEKEKRKHG